jgi:hypothetical protein
MKLYYADSQNKTAGPVTQEELQVLIRAGVIKNDPMVVVEGGTEWKLLSTISPSAPDSIQRGVSSSGGNNTLVYAIAAILLGGSLFFAFKKPAHGITNNPQQTQANERNQVINVFRQIDAAENQFALEKGKITGDSVNWDDLKPYLKGGKQPQHPGGGYYILHPIGENPTSSKYGNLLR